MKIAWISKIEWNMPHKTSRLKLSEALIKRGHDVTLYMVKKFGEKSSGKKCIVSLPTIPLPILSGFFYGLTVFFFFPVLLHRKKVDIIIIDCTKVWIPFIASLKILNIPMILDIRTLPIGKDETFFFKVSMNLSRYVFDGITTITPELKNILIKTYNLEKMNIGVWSSGVSLKDFEFSAVKAIKFYNMKSHKKNYNLIYHGDYAPTRGIENLIKAIGKLNSDLKNKTILTIIGIPENKINDLITLSMNEGVNEQIKILPKVSYNKINYYIQIADVGVVPLPPEKKWWKVSAPLKTLEYLAAGKPIIVTNIPFHRRIFEKGNCGLLIKSGSPNAIAEGMTTMYKNKDDFGKMGSEGRKIVEKFYTWDVIAENFEYFFKKLCK